MNFLKALRMHFKTISLLRRILHCKLSKIIPALHFWCFARAYRSLITISSVK